MAIQYNESSDEKSYEKRYLPSITQWILVSSPLFVLAITIMFFLSAVALAFSFFDNLPPPTKVNEIVWSAVYPLISIVFGGFAGFVPAIYQSRILRRYGISVRAWFDATLIGSSIAYAILVMGLLISAYVQRYGIIIGQTPPAIALIFAAVLSFPQAFILRRWRSCTVAWFLVSTASFALALLSFNLFALKTYWYALTCVVGISLLYGLGTYWSISQIRVHK